MTISAFLIIDEIAKVIDILFKFSANSKIPMHKHTSHYSTFTVKEPGLVDSPPTSMMFAPEFIISII